MPTADWTTALDEFEVRLEAIRDATAAGNAAAVPPFVPPAGLGPMPEEVVARARQLLIRSRELELTISQARDAIRSRLSASPSTPAVRGRSRLDISV